MLEAIGEVGGEAGRPGVVDEADFEHVAEVRAVFVTEGGQLHPDEGLEGQDAKGGAVGLDGIGDVGGGGVVLGTDLFAGDDDVDGVAGLGLCAVEEHVDAARVAADEASGLESRGCRIEIGAAQEDYRSRFGNVVPMSFWHLRTDDPAKVQALFDQFAPMMDFYEATVGPFPFGDEKMGVVETPHLGMEHQTINAYGNEYKLESDTVALCRCGGSTNKPFCDGTHSRIGFAAAEAAVPGSGDKPA